VTRFLHPAMKTRTPLLLLCAALAALHAPAGAQLPFTLSVREAALQPAPALQSFAIGTWKGQWLLVGGRRTGFHGTSGPQSTFPSAFANDSLYVVDPAGGRAWRAPLPPEYGMRLRVNNMQFAQDGETLFVVGGYGSDCDTDDRRCYQTYPTLTAINVPGVMAEVMSASPDPARIGMNILGITDERMRVTGGGLKRVGDDYYLVFGQNYDSIYKGGYTGKYTQAVRRFRIDFNGSRLAVADFVEYTDPAGSGPASQYHRRDLNVVETVWPGGVNGLAVYGGVFTPEGGAWMNPLYVTPQGTGAPRIQVDTGFTMRTSPYECAQVLMYDPASGTMYTSLLGGISLYYYDAAGRLVPSTPADNWLPWVNTITTLARRSDGTTEEVVQPPAQGLPGLLGANSVFLPAPGLARVAGSEEVIDYAQLPAGRVLLGHMYGGIRATASQSSEMNPTFASSTIYEVWLER
jgi:hypothetical protein